MIAKESGAIVAPAEVDEPRWLARLKTEVMAQYKKALDHRLGAVRSGLEIGRAIIAACWDTGIVAEVAVLNSPEKNEDGGTPRKIYCVIADRVASACGYNQEYLRSCARQYLNGLNRKLKDQGKDPLAMERGLFSVPKPAMPNVQELEKFLHPEITKQPSIEESIAEPAATPDGNQQQQTNESEELKKKIDRFIQRELGLVPGIFNPARCALIAERFNPVLQRNGYVITRIGKQPKA